MALSALERLKLNRQLAKIRNELKSNKSFTPLERLKKIREHTAILLKLGVGKGTAGGGSPAQPAPQPAPQPEPQVSTQEEKDREFLQGAIDRRILPVPSNGVIWHEEMKKIIDRYPENEEKHKEMAAMTHKALESWVGWLFEQNEKLL